MKDKTALTSAIAELLNNIDADSHTFNHQLYIIKGLKAEYDRAGQERFTVCYLQSYQYAVYDTTDDLYVDRHRNPSNVGYFTEEEARAVAKHLNSL